MFLQEEGRGGGGGGHLALAANLVRNTLRDEDEHTALSVSDSSFILTRLLGGNSGSRVYRCEQEKLIHTAVGILWGNILSLHMVCVHEGGFI